MEDIYFTDNMSLENYLLDLQDLLESPTFRGDHHPPIPDVLPRMHGLTEEPTLQIVHCNQVELGRIPVIEVEDDEPELKTTKEPTFPNKVENIETVTQNDVHEDYQGTSTDDTEDYARDKSTSHGDGLGSYFHKRRKLDNINLENGSSFQDYNIRLHSEGIAIGMNQMFPEESKTALAQQEIVPSRFIHLEEQKQKLQRQKLELENKRFKLQQTRMIEDRELDEMILHNQILMIENERLALGLKCEELEIKHNRTRN